MIGRTSSFIWKGRVTLKAKKFAMLIWSLVLSAFLFTVMSPTAGLASTAGKKNTAIGLGAASVYSLIRGHTGTGLLLGAGAVYANKRYSDSRKHDKHKYVKHHKSVRYTYRKAVHKN
jgi:hypothetical protein